MSIKQKKEIDTRLSYSSGKLLQGCSQKYWHYKVNSTKKDNDVVEGDAFAVGKAFHQVLENLNHEYLPELIPIELKKACTLHGVEDKQALINGMILKYYKLHMQTGLKAKVCEIQLDNEIFIGFVDAIMVDPMGKWWVVDLKTAASIYPVTYTGLSKDTQLNLYASFAKEIADNVEGLELEDFGGCRYRVTSKPKLKQKARENYEEFVLRIANSARSLDVVIPAEKLNAEEAYTLHKDLHAMSLGLREGTIKPVKNRSHCTAYFRTCEYFSQCYGSTATTCNDELQIVEA